MPITTYADVGRPLTISEHDGNVVTLDARTKLGWRDNIVPFDVEVGNPNAPVLNVVRGNIKRYAFFAGELSEASAWARGSRSRPTPRLSPLPAKTLSGGWT